MKPIRTLSPPVEVNARHIPAELEIRQRPPEIQADWVQVWEERGVRRHYTLIKELTDKAQRELAEEIVVKARQGDESADLRNREPNIFGRHAFENYMRRSKVEVVLDAVPRFGVKFDVRVYPPEIEVRTPGANRFIIDKVPRR
ncbi:MAG: hypothetical protein BAA02_11840 [Paenibacillaceae bacterium ZCTH02-B3]|nr:MAG: hypothetical protein BAA02_11840 [Paenibacillaceae bacterium ZCTH02-B3]